MAWFANQGFAGTIDFSINPTTGAYGNANISAGPGISVSGNTVTNDGIRSIIAGGGLQLGGDVLHNPTISLAAGSTGVEQCLAGTGISVTGDPAIPLITNTGVLSVTGTGVDNTDPQNPVLTVVESLTAGTNVAITGTASNPIISATGGGGGGPSSDLFTIVEQDVTFSDLASAAVVTLFTAAAGVDYLIAAIQVDETLSTNFSGGGGDRGLEFVGGGSTVGQLSDTNLQNIAGVFDEIPGQVPVSFSVSYLGLRNIGKGGTVYCSYTGGTTDYTAGSLHVKIYLINTNATAIGGGDNIVYVKDVSITAAGLASGGQVTILNNTDPAGQYEVITAYTLSGTPFSGGGGDWAIINFTDGITNYGGVILADTDLSQSYPYIASNSNNGGIRLNDSTAISTPTQPGANIYAEYIAGSIDYSVGELKLSMVLRKIAGNNSVGVQEVVAGPGATVDNTNPQYPIVSASGGIVVDVDVTAADLAGGADVALFTPTGSDIWIVIGAAIVGSLSTDFSGGGGDRDLAIEASSIDGELQYSFNLIALSTLSPDIYQSAQDVKINQIGHAIRAHYTGGSTDWASGSAHIRLYLLNTSNFAAFP